MRAKTVLSLLILITASGSFMLFTAISKKEDFLNKDNPSKVYSLEVRKNDKDNYWYYEISRGNRLMIKQEFVPGIPRRTPFTNKKEAEIIGALVLSRLNKNLPPTITSKDVEKYLATK